MVTRTVNFNLELVNFDTTPWHEKEHDNWRTIDAVFSNFIVVNNVQGVWQNATAVTVGQKYIDGDLGTIFTVLIAHTTPSTGTFAVSRAAVSANWETYTVSIASRGVWATSTVYNPNDFVQDGTRYGIVQGAYISGASYDVDVTNGDIVTLIEAGDLISSSPVANTLTVGSSATVSFDSDTGVFTFGLPTGATGATVLQSGLTYDDTVFAVTGNITATGTIEPAGDTAAADNAAIGYTSVDGLILTGQGSTADVSLKNDADTTVCYIPTGTNYVRFGDSMTESFGDSDDIKVYHTGSYGYITNSTGTMHLGSDALNLTNLAVNASYVTMVNGAAVTLFYNNSQRLITTATGAVITGTILASTDTDTSNTGNITLDFGANQNFVLTFTGNVTLDNPTTEQVGQAGVIVCIQDGTGSRTLSLGSQFKTAGDAGITLSTAANAVDIIPYFVSAADSILIGAVQLALSGA